MKLPKYLLCANKTGNPSLPAPIILGTEKPYHIGKVWRFKDPQAYLDCINSNQFIAFQVIGGYKLVISYDGTLEGRNIILEPEIRTRLTAVLNEMENFYREERIEDNPGFYKQYLL